MRHRVLPGTDLSLSIVGFGCWPLGGEYWGPTDESAHRAAIETALELGITWFDTAPLYGNGNADEVLASTLGSRIHDVVIATKVGVSMAGEHAQSDLRAEHIVADCEASLRRLKEPIDLLQVHWPCDRGTPLEETAAALDGLVDRGWIRHWGVCNYGADDLRALRPASVQVGYSLMRREAENDVLPTAAELGIGVLAYEGLCRGLLTGKYRSPPRFSDDDMRSRDPRFKGAAFAYGAALARDLGRVGERIGVSGSAVALGWVASRVTAVIAGCRSPEQVRQNVDASRVAGSAKVIDVVDRIVSGRTPPRW